MVDVAIIADDLTGALDAAAPFATRGRRVEAAVSPEAISDIDGSADIITINAATRSRSAAEATSVVREVAGQVAALRPRVLIKKVDSTLRGHVAEEVSAVAAAAQRYHAVVCPAVPDQGRIVRSGILVVSGRAVAAGSAGGAIAPLFETAGLAGGVSVCDAASGNDLLEVADLVLREPYGTIAVGAAGLAGALAEKLYGPGRAEIDALAPPGLFVVGSRAPASLAQLQELDGDPRILVTPVDPTSPDVPPTRHGAAIELVRPDPASVPEGTPEAVLADRIAAITASRFKALAPGMLFLCGGHIAERVLAALAVQTVSVVAELEPGVPITSARVDGRLVTIVTKSGEFGDPRFLLRLADRVASHPEPEKRRLVVP